MTTNPGHTPDSCLKDQLWAFPAWPLVYWFTTKRFSEDQRVRDPPSYRISLLACAGTAMVSPPDPGTRMCLCPPTGSASLQNQYGPVWISDTQICLGEHNTFGWTFPNSCSVLYSSPSNWTYKLATNLCNVLITLTFFFFLLLIAVWKYVEYSY